MLLTTLVCCIAYPSIVWVIGNAIIPDKAEGSLIRDSNGVVIGSHLIAQGFSRPEYIWPRPSAVDYNASASGGSNLSPTNPVLKERIEQSLANFQSDEYKTVPTELVLASGSGLDPHITLEGALFQAARVAKARGVDSLYIRELINTTASVANPLSGQASLINVLELNMILDRDCPVKKQ